MPTGTAIKQFDVEEGSIEGMHYRITVRYHGRVVKQITRPTMREARQEFEQEGFKPVAWAEGQRIVLRG